MKTFYKLSTVFFLFLLITFLIKSAGWAGNSSTYISDEKSANINVDNSTGKHTNVAAELIKDRKSSFAFPEFELLRFEDGNDLQAKSFSSDAVILELDKNLLKSFNELSPRDIKIKIPFGPSNKYMELMLSRIEVFSENYKVNEITRSGNIYHNYKGGLYYTGIIKDDNNSIASLSVFENSVMAIISTGKGNYVLGSAKNGNKYIFYNDINLIEKPKFECKSGDSYNELYRSYKIPSGTPNSSSTTSPVRMYYVCDYQMYLDNGSNINNVGNFVTGAFVHVKTLYLNENINVEISAIDVYNFADPYRSYSTSQTFEILKLFGTNTQDNFNGDLAQLLSSRTPVMGGIAWIKVLCQSYEPSSQSGRYSFCQIENTYSPYPVFSWTVEVMTHEAGHNFGSMHTHACVWPVFPFGGIGAIDSCYDAEGNCFTFTVPNNNGTIMSYCHLNGNINFLNGFGSLPGDTIRLRYNQAVCLDSANFSSEQPVTFGLLQNYPNPFNPGTSIKFALPEGGYVSIKIYDLMGKEVAAFVNNKYYPIGIFSAYFDASHYNLSSGVYFYRIDVNRNAINVFSEIKKMVLVK
ncbi:MAG TPA: M12 family metallo-peptidase [Ignavibacteria bacterium]|jgi:hypothetical protein